MRTSLERGSLRIASSRASSGSLTFEGVSDTLLMFPGLPGLSLHSTDAAVAAMLDKLRSRSLSAMPPSGGICLWTI